MSDPGRQAVGAPLASAVYEGLVTHRRHAPRSHAFCYRMAQLYLDLDELDRVFRGRPLWSVGRRNLAEFRRSDYLGDANHPLSDAVRDRAEQVLGWRPLGAIRLLTHLRYAGYLFNPVSFYYCYSAQMPGQLECLIAEITNTPWHERHAYVLSAAQAARRGRRLCWSTAKTFHVSPFQSLASQYQWEFTIPAEDLCVHMAVQRQGKSEFEASLVLRRRALDASSLRRVLWRYPLMTLQVTGAIYWQALRLWMKGNPVHTHPATR